MLQIWFYLALILAPHSRRVVAWAVSDRIKKDLANPAFNMAVWLRKPEEDCLLNSDCGSQNCSYVYLKKLQAHGLQGSMSGKCNCCDSFTFETFSKSLKAQPIWRQK
jgi:transposase InsO family protein